MRAALITLAVASTVAWAEPPQVTIQVPVTARIEMSKFNSIFVVGFATNRETNEKFDLNRETITFLRNELKGRTPLQVLDPEDEPSLDSADDAIFVDEGYWQRLGARFPGALLVTGKVRLSSERRSGFRTEEVVSPTGIPVRVQRFREGRFIILDMDLHFIDGSTGRSLQQEGFHEELMYENADQPTLYGYYDLMDRVLQRFLGVVVTQKYQETRYLLE